ncbi:hypothetical protein PoB_004125200 [Plakobranchus ocellatus]|uniref:Uncharacterized protein n=1 Tax=Plakobranchus ocellatus TaxID=259542 RepID=A0AAV4B6K8_9GAST|nr:hypothetical protein PoB_004125200 [Plakobranchus ocellatus]
MNLYTSPEKSFHFTDLVLCKHKLKAATENKHQPNLLFVPGKQQSIAAQNISSLPKSRGPDQDSTFEEINVRIFTKLTVNYFKIFRQLNKNRKTMILSQIKVDRACLGTRTLAPLYIGFM